MGHNGNIGFGYTVNYSHMGDQYFETFNHPTDLLQYKYGTGYKKAVAWTDSIFVKKESGREVRIVHLLKTHHGPIIKQNSGQLMAVKLVNIEKRGWLQQWYNMTKATSLEQFKKALSPIAMPYLNVVSADKNGNIYFLYNMAVPKRKKGFDWTKPVDGSNPQTEWQGMYSMKALPQITNPASGFIQNCNSDATYVARRGTFNKKDFPDYMNGDEEQNPRSQRSLILLSGKEPINFATLERITMEVRCQLADDSLTSIIAELDRDLQKDTAKAALLSPLVDALRSWDHYADTASVGMTLFREIINYHRTAPMAFLPALEQTKMNLEKVWGTWKVGWNLRNRLQKIPWNSINFSDDKWSAAIAGASGNYGTMFCSNANKLSATGNAGSTRKRYMTAGSSYTSVIELGSRVQAKSIMPFGQQETGPHSEDQMPLFIKRQYKEAWFYKADVMKHAEHTYHPGE